MVFIVLLNRENLVDIVIAKLDIYHTMPTLG